MEEYQGRGPLGRSSSKWKNNIKTDFKEKDRGMSWIDVAVDWDKWQPVVKAVMYHRFT